jgi:hypothetical protein
MSVRDFTVIDVANLMQNFGLHAEHQGYLEKLELLDLSTEKDARHAIKQWLLPAFQEYWGKTVSGQVRMRESLRVALSRWGFLPHGPSLPGIDSCLLLVREPQDIYTQWRQFYRLLWDELFHEPFELVANTDTLQERIDSAFVNAPGQPERWGTPQYRPLTYWDELLRADAWRENWMPNRS